MLYPFAVLFSLQCTATLRIAFIKSWQNQFLPEQLRRFVLGDVKDHLALGEVFESEDSPFEEEGQGLETERPLVIDPTEGEFPTLTTLPPKLAAKDRSEVPRRTGIENLITDDGIELVPKTQQLKTKATQQRSPDKRNRSIHANAGSGTTKFDVDSPKDENQYTHKSRSLLQVPKTRSFRDLDDSGRSGSPVREPVLLPLPKAPAQAADLQVVPQKEKRIKRQNSAKTVPSPEAKPKSEAPRTIAFDPQAKKLLGEGRQHKDEKVSVSDLSEVRPQPAKKVADSIDVFVIETSPISVEPVKEVKIMNKATTDVVQVDVIEAPLVMNVMGERVNHVAMDHSDQKITSARKHHEPQTNNRPQPQMNVTPQVLQQDPKFVKQISFGLNKPPKRSKTPEVMAERQNPIQALNQFLQELGGPKTGKTQQNGRNEQSSKREAQREQPNRRLLKTNSQQRVRDSTASFGRRAEKGKLTQKAAIVTSDIQSVAVVEIKHETNKAREKSMEKTSNSKEPKVKPDQARKTKEKSKANPTKNTKPDQIQKVQEQPRKKNLNLIDHDEAPSIDQAAAIDLKEDRVWLTEEKEATGQFDSLQTLQKTKKKKLENQLTFEDQVGQKTVLRVPQKIQKTFSEEPNLVKTVAIRTSQSLPKEERKIQQMIDKVAPINHLSPVADVEVKRRVKREKPKTPKQPEAVDWMNAWQRQIKQNQNQIPVSGIVETGYQKFDQISKSEKPRAKPKVKNDEEEKKQQKSRFAENKEGSTVTTNPQSTKHAAVSDAGFEILAERQKLRHVKHKSDQFFQEDEGPEQPQQTQLLIGQENQARQLQTDESEEFRLVQEAELKFNQIVYANQPWTDPDFGPADESLYRQGETEGKFGEVVWRRVSEITPNAVLFKDGIDPGDINQGELGDCYFLSVISSMADDPAEMKRLFYISQLNKAGCQLIYFMVNGHKTPVLVDDYLPCRDGKLIFAHARGQEFWVCLLEKAWAKLHGSYSAISKGQPALAFGQVAGYPSRAFTHAELDDRDKFWQRLLLANRKNFCMIASTHSQDGGQGLIPDHCYSLISLHEIVYNRKAVKLLKLRNPWGHAEWKGAWGDQSTLWTQKVRQELKHEVKDDGIFFMSFPDYVKHFFSTTICIENRKDRATVSNCMFDFSASNAPQAFLKFRLSKAVDLSRLPFAISVQQQGNRMTYHDPDPKKQFKPAHFNLILMREDGTYVDSNFGKDHLFSLFVRPDVQLGPGNYILMVDPVWNESADLDPKHRVVQIGVHCHERVKLDCIDFFKGISHLADTLKHFAINRSPQDLRDFYLASNETYREEVWRLRDVNSMDYAFIYTQNNSKHRLTERIDLKLQGYEVIYPAIKNKLVIDLSPGGDEIIILKRTATDAEYKMTYITCPIVRSDEELLDATIEDGKVMSLGNSKACLRLMNALDAAVLMVSNPTNQQLSVEFSLTLQNLKLVGRPDGAASFQMTVEPGQQGIEILRPIKLGKKTDIQVRTKFQLK